MQDTEQIKKEKIIIESLAVIDGQLFIIVDLDYIPEQCEIISKDTKDKMIQEAIQARDKEILEEIEKMKRVEYGEASMWQLAEVGREEYAHKNKGYNQALDDIIKLIQSK